MTTTGIALIDRARALGHADAEIARRLGVSRSYLCDIAAGRKMMSPPCAVLLAVLCGADADEALRSTTCENEQNADRRDRLRRALFFAWVAGAGCLLAIGASYPLLTFYTLSRMPERFP